MRIAITKEIWRSESIDDCRGDTKTALTPFQSEILRLLADGYIVFHEGSIGGAWPRINA